VAYDSRCRELDTNIAAQATGTPIIVDVRFDAAFALIACHVLKPSHFLQRNPSIAITGISRTTIAGHVRKIIGTPASASSGSGTKER